MSYYTDHGTANDWEVCTVAQAGGAVGIGAGIFMFVFRSKNANCRGPFVFTAAALGASGSIGGGSGPSPADVARNQVINPFKKLNCRGYFTADDLDLSVGQLFTAGIEAAYGYNIVRISAGLFPVLFHLQSVSGWGTGVGAHAGVFTGVWKQLGTSSTYY